jgi:hypothetical protein
MPTRLIVLVTSIAFISSSAIAQSLSLDSLQTRCAQKTLVMSREGVQIGTKLNDYCAGFLEGALALMTREKFICPDEHVDSVFLLSVFDVYVNDKKLKGSDNLAEAIEAAYQRAFSCKK